MRAGEIGERDRMVAVGKLEDQAAGAGPADRLDLDPGGVGAPQEGEQAIVGDGGDVDALILGEIAFMAVPTKHVQRFATNGCGTLWFPGESLQGAAVENACFLC